MSVNSDKHDKKKVPRKFMKLREARMRPEKGFSHFCSDDRENKFFGEPYCASSGDNGTVVRVYKKY
jgi:hypothetical protein